MNTRLQQFISAENITQAEFADSLGVARASISHILSGRNKPGYEFISSLMLRYPHLNMDWLINGQGKMYRNSEKNGQTEKQVDLFSVQQNPDDKAQIGQDTPEATTTPLEDSDSKAGDDEVSDTVEIPAKSAQILPMNPSVSVKRKAAKVVIFFDDGTYQELSE